MDQQNNTDILSRCHPVAEQSNCFNHERGDTLGPEGSHRNGSQTEILALIPLKVENLFADGINCINEKLKKLH